MNTRALTLHVVFSAVALLFAWRMANREEEEVGGPTSTTLLDVAEGGVEKADYRWPKGSAQVTRARGDLVVSVDRELDEKKPTKKDDKKPTKKDDQKGDDELDAGVAEVVDAGVAEEPKRESVTFPGGKSVSTAVGLLEPLKTRRTLGLVEGDRLRAMGLEKPERTLQIVSRKGTLVLEIGESAYGGQGRYARVRGDSAVHLIDASIVTGFEGGADALMEKRVLPLDPEEVTAFEARWGEKSGAWLQLDRAQAKTRRFVTKADPDTAVEAAQKVMATVRGMRVQKLAQPASAGSSVALFKVASDKGERSVEILERTDGAGYLARYGPWLGELSETQQKELMEDLGTLWGD